MAARGRTSGAASSGPHVRRVSWMVIRRTPARAHRMSKARLMFRGSIGLPLRVVSTSECDSPQMHFSGQPSVRTCAWCCRAGFSAVRTIGGSVSVLRAPLLSRTYGGVACHPRLRDSS
jgi:hypothetical protein